MKKITLYLIFCFVTLTTYADNFDDVVTAIKSSNAKLVAHYFNSSVELMVLSNEGVYSKSQAEIILKNFLAANPPQNVTLQHKGSSAQGSKYAIAIYECQQGKYRAYIFMKDSGSGMLIHELRFEKE